MKTLFLFLSAWALMTGAVGAQTSYGNLEEGNAGDNGDSSNSYFGYEAGWSNSNIYNTFIGYLSGHDNSSGSYNSFLGSNSGRYNSTGSYNIFIGSDSGRYNDIGGSNTFIGHDSGRNNSGSSHNTFVGARSGRYSIGYDNTFVGRGSGEGNATSGGGSQNVFIGAYSGNAFTTGAQNTFVGRASGYGITSGSNNTFIGRESGYNNQTGSGNVFLGYQAGYNETGSNKLYIDNSSTSTPLIWGDFSANRIGINHNNPAYTLQVGGDIGATTFYGSGAELTSLNATNLSTGTVNNLRLDADLQDLADGTLSASRVEHNSYFITSAGVAGQVWQSDGSGAGAWTTLNINDADADATNEIQDLSLSNNTLSLSEDGTPVNLAAYLDNTDNQELSIIDTQLSITGGNNVDLSFLQDNLGDHSVTQHLLPNSNTLNLGSASSEFGSLYFYRALYTDGGEFLHTRDNCIAIGNTSLPLASSGSMNVAVGDNTLFSNSTGANNVALGFDALTYNTTGNNNVVIGNNSGPANGNGIYNNSIALGSNVTLTASNQVRIGNNSAASIGGYQPWTNLSDGRFKKAVKEDIPGLAFIEQLRPVSYEIDRTKLNTFLKKDLPEELKTTLEDEEANTTKPIYQNQQRSIGFVAQEVETVLAKSGYTRIGIESPQNENDPYSIRYAEFVVPLTKAVQELSTLVKAQQQENQTQKQLIEALQQKVIALENQHNSVQTPGADGQTPAQSQLQPLSNSVALYQNVPNPFNRTTVIAAQLPQMVRQAKIVVYNLQGLELASYPLTGRGEVSVEISGGRFPAGMYLYALVADGQVIDTKKMVLTK